MPADKTAKPCYDAQNRVCYNSFLQKSYSTLYQLADCKLQSSLSPLPRVEQSESASSLALKFFIYIYRFNPLASREAGTSPSIVLSRCARNDNIKLCTKLENKLLGHNFGKTSSAHCFNHYPKILL